MRMVVIVAVWLIFTGCSSVRTDPPDATATIDSLISNDKFSEAEPVIRAMLAKAGTDSLKAKLYSRYALCKNETNDDSSALYYYQLSAGLLRNTVLKYRLGNVLLEMGMIYTSKKFYTEAMRCYTEALQNYNTRSDSISVYNAICVHYINQEKYDSTYNTITKYLNRYEKDIDNSASYYIYFGKGLYFYSTGNDDTALLFLQKAANNAVDSLHKANTFTNIADVYKHKHNFLKAIAYLDSSGLLCGSNMPVENRQFDYETYREIYDSMRDVKRAYHYAKLSRSISDSIYYANSKNAMIDAVTTAKTKAERAEKEKAQADVALKNRSLIFTAIALGLVVLLAFVSLRNTRIKQKANQLLIQQKQQVQQLADQLTIANDTKARLFSTIGHDLRSPVSSLYASLKMQELKGNATGGEMSEQTVRLLDTLEELLIWSKSQMDGFKVQLVKVNVRYFFEDLKDFYSNAAVAKNITIVNNTSKEVIIRTDENLLKTIFRNAISNAITNTASGNSIYLNAEKMADESICISVRNPCTSESFHNLKVSFDDAVVKSGAYGLGIVLMKEFAQKLNGKIDLTYVDGSACVNLCI